MRTLLTIATLVAASTVAVGQSCPEPIPFVNNSPCTIGPGLHIEKTIREINGVHEVLLAIQTSSTTTTQYSISITTQKADGTLIVDHQLVNKMPTLLWTRVYFQFVGKPLSVSIQEVAAPTSFSLVQ